jgi:RIO kinase 1
LSNERSEEALDGQGPVFNEEQQEELSGEGPETILDTRIDSKIIQRAIQQWSKYERQSRILRKNAEESKVFEEVFDRDTLLTLYEMMNSGVISYLNGVVSAGKESRVYWGIAEKGQEKRDVAVKIYLVSSVEFKKRLPYIQGDPRFQRIKRNTRGVVELWARKEFVNLKTAYESEIRVPRPIDVRGNVLAMEFIGNGGVPAPRLIDSKVTLSDFNQLVKITRRLLVQAHLVHADLSEYNVFKSVTKRKIELIAFDFGSAVDIKHPMAREFLERDVRNISRFFERRGVPISTAFETLQKVTKDIEF